MSEEKPVLKVTDRRLFNPDGSPRDIERVEKTNATTTTPGATGDAAALASSANSSQANPTTPNAAASTLPVDAESAPPLSAAADVAPPPSSSSSQSARTAPAEKERQAAVNPAAEPVAEEDPTAFVNLLMFIASPAAAALGLTEHPGIAADETDLPLAKHCIDLLGTLRQKTKGNVTGQEDEIFENLLAELRMQFVSLSGARGSSAASGGGGGARGGFSGSDITGGGS
ncbi:MAG: DUF1844 domain-containing protein [Pyrinomonadaceae bacterium]